MKEKNAYSLKNIIIRRLSYYLEFFKDGDKEERKYYNQVDFEIEHIRKIFGRKVEYDDNTKILPRFVISIGNYCTLRCKECSQLVPYVKNHYYENIDNLLEKISNLLNDVEVCVCVDIVGGEPLLYKDLDKLLLSLLGNGKVGIVEITTNGTIIPTTDLLEAVSNYGKDKVLFKFSDYSDFSKKEEIIDLLVERNIKYECISMPVWYKFGNDSIRKNNKTLAEMKYQYYYCMDNVACKTVTKGKLYTCGRGAGLDDYGIPTIEKEDWLSLDNKIDYNTLKEFYTKKQYSAICDYCGDYSTDSMKIIPVAEQKK